MLFNMNDTGELVSEHEEDTCIEENEESDDSFDVFNPKDTHEVLVIRQSLSIQEIESDEEQRTNIFHSRCTIKGKPCSCIIDSGSCTNVVSSFLVDKLQLQTMKHPRPYALQWLHDGAELKVTRQSLVSFNMGNYHDEILCDVIPMQATHL